VSALFGEGGPPPLAVESSELLRGRFPRRAVNRLRKILMSWKLEANRRCVRLQLVDGEDPSPRIARGAVLLDEGLPIAKQIAGALER
jgi:hypothetical protein